jgi:hypothetical protein
MEPRYEQYMAITGFLPVYDTLTEYSSCETTADDFQSAHCSDEEEQSHCGATPDPAVQPITSETSETAEARATSDITAVEAAVILVELHADQTTRVVAPEPVTEACFAVEDSEPMLLCDRESTAAAGCAPPPTPDKRAQNSKTSPKKAKRAHLRGLRRTCVG